MTIATQRISSERDDAGDWPGITRPMTYEEYLDGPEEMARYDILDGWKVYRLYGVSEMANPSKAHQRILRRIARALEDFEAQTAAGQVIIAPCDVLITLRPLRSRQPDLLFIGQERMAQNVSMEDATPLEPAPELVVEILSPSERASTVADKVADYRAADVREVWLVRPESRTVELLMLSVDQARSVATYGVGESIVSLTFPGLVVSLDTIFVA